MATEPKNRAVGREITPKETPVLTLHVRGPGIRSGRISIPDLVKICHEAQTAVNRLAESLEGRNTIHPGPIAEQIRHECTLELIAIRKGSTTLDFGLAIPQIALPFEEMRNFGSEVVRELADTIQSLGNGNKKLELDPGVLQSIYGRGASVESGRNNALEGNAPKT